MTDIDRLFHVIENNEKVQFARMMDDVGLQRMYPGMERFRSMWPLLRRATYAYCHELLWRVDVPIWPLELPSGVIDMRRFGCFGNLIVTAASRKLRTSMVIDEDVTMADVEQLGMNIACESADLIGFNMPCVYVPYVPIVPMSYVEGTATMKFASREAIGRPNRDNFSVRVHR